MSITAFPNGISSFGVPVLGAGGGIPSTTGTYIFVSSTTGSDSNSGLDDNRAVATLAQGITLSTASVGDVIIVMPGHAETISTTLTPKAGTTIVGLGNGRNRPVFTASTGAIDTFTISAANVTLSNIVIVGAASGVTALVECSSNDLLLSGVELAGGVAPTTLVTFSNAGATRPVLENCIVRAAAGTAVIIAAEVTGACCQDMRITNMYIHGSSVRDIDTAVIQSSKANCTGLIVNGLYVVGVVGGDNPAGVFDFNSSTGAVDGMLTGVRFGFDAAVTFTEAMDLGGMLSVENYGTDIVSAKGTAWPATTAS